jgi:trk system potassium uptake protein TrkH
MNLKVTFKILGALILFLSCAFLLPVPVGIVDGDGTHWALILAALVGGLAGGTVLYICGDAKPELGHREGFAVVTLGWALFGIVGALPYFFAGATPTFIDAVFESLSGFTTTGATILTDIEALPRSLHLWRSLTHWMGGMGIIVLSLAILPMLGVGGMQLFKAEVPGPTTDRLSPRIQDTAKLLWGVYVGLTAVEIVLLMFGGMDWFDATCHSFATLATGGFSTKNASVAGFDSAYIDYVITLFMFLAGVNFALHYAWIAGKPLRMFKNEEFRWYTTITVAATIVLMIANWGGTYDSVADNLRYSVFQSVSILTTTGFGTADYELWPYLCQVLLILMMFIGGSAGSTGGGAKVSRMVLIVKHATVQMWRLIHPRGVRRVKLDGHAVPEDVLQSILGFFALYLAVTGVASMVMGGLGVEPVTAVASVIASIGNIGPGLGGVGPTDNYAHLPQLGKVVLSFCMLMGRLEIFTVLALLYPGFWRR